ncbi:unnamed protein product [Urochloa humidicola]
MTTTGRPASRRNRKIKPSAACRPTYLWHLGMILLRGCACRPIKDLCRLRAVCRPWRSLLSAPAFVRRRPATRAARQRHHPDQLLVAGCANHRSMNNGGVLLGPRRQADPAS